ncbi:MAG: hypothetical protein IJ488_02900 [Clostridia bacterium]|nr:hypothetical protein [Clostridia bacterium]
MELIKELLFDYFCSEKPDEGDILDLNNIVEKECYKALKAIKEIVGNDNLDDDDCFERIEQIVCVLEGMGIDCGGRHDFG